MKFNINAKVFKNITERVAIILNKKSAFPAFKTLVIETDDFHGINETFANAVKDFIESKGE